MEFKKEDYQNLYKKLLSHYTETQRSDLKPNDGRSRFDSDYDRIIFSSPFRRLQDKAQVFPLEKSDFVRTRLTHSLEVAAIAKSIGLSIEKELLDRGYLSEDDNRKIPVILECAGLAHDLGNPPFGHFGEETIKKVFKNHLNKEFKVNDCIIKLNDYQENDFFHFDGNCQTIRILTRLQCLSDDYGLHLTYATLATLMKYPFNSLDGNKKNKGVSYKKFGYFQSEKNIADKILTEVGTKVSGSDTKRHPLAFLLEAADDIAYSAADLEDGFKKKVLTLEDIKFYFKDIPDALSLLNDLLNDQNYITKERVIQKFRIILQGEMISAVTNAFIENQEAILNGSFKEELLMMSSAKEIRSTLKNIAKNKILSNVEIYKTELAGESTLEFLLNFFIDALVKENFLKSAINNFDDSIKDEESKIDGRQRRIYNLISEDFRAVYQKSINEIKKSDLTENEKYANILYNTYLLVTDYISCMTDNYSVDLYRKLKGILLN